MAFALPDMAGAEGVVQVEVPGDVAAEVGRVTGGDVAGVPVFRGPAADDAARGRGARAFAREGAVFLPDSAGPVTSARARGLLAHELVHVVQQRRLGRVPGGEVGRRMEAEAVAVERRYGSSVAGGAELRHPPVRAPELDGPAQLASTALAPPDPALSRFDTPEREEIVRLAESSAHRVVEEWSRPEPGRAGGFRSPSGGGFDRAARRHELEAEMLEEINADRLEAGEPLLSALEPGHVERLESRLDREEITGERRRGGRSRSSGSTPPLAGGAVGGTVSFTETVGGEAAGAGPHGGRGTGWGAAQRAGHGAGHGAGQGAGHGAGPGAGHGAVRGGRYGARAGDAGAAATRLGLAAALSAPDSRALPREQAEETLPEVEGGVFGDAVSFTERRGDDRHQGGKWPDPDMHGSEQDRIDLDRVDLEDLTNRLYDRLRGRLRLELLVDRERAGILTDFR